MRPGTLQNLRKGQQEEPGTCLSADGSISSLSAASVSWLARMCSGSNRPAHSSRSGRHATHHGRAAPAQACRRASAQHPPIDQGPAACPSGPRRVALLAAAAAVPAAASRRGWAAAPALQAAVAAEWRRQLPCCSLPMSLPLSPPPPQPQAGARELAQQETDCALAAAGQGSQGLAPSVPLPRQQQASPSAAGRRRAHKGVPPVWRSPAWEARAAPRCRQLLPLSPLPPPPLVWSWCTPACAGSLYAAAC